MHLVIRGRLAPFVIPLAVLVTPPVAAQEPPDLRFAPTMEEMIEHAQSEGRLHPLPEDIPDWWDSRPVELGGPERTCTSTAGQSQAFAPVQSGEFVVGAPFRGVANGRPVKMWWAPAENSRHMKLLVRGRKLGDEDAILRWENERVAYPVGPNPPRKAEEVDDWFFPSIFTLPSPGTWIIVATSGPNWGCFVVSAT